MVLRLNVELASSLDHVSIKGASGRRTIYIIWQFWEVLDLPSLGIRLRLLLMCELIPLWALSH